MVVTHELSLHTQANCDIQDITPHVEKALSASGLESGIVTVFCVGSTGGVTTIEYESGVASDIQQVLDETVPTDRDYRHHLRWGDDNGHSHVRAALIGPSLTVPFVNRRLALGTWQQIVFMNFDTRSRSRQVILQMMGE